MADKNVQLQSKTNDNLYPKTKAEVVMVTDTEVLSDKIDEMDASIEQAQQTATGAKQTADTVSAEVTAARVDGDDTPETHTNLKGHFDKIWVKLKTIVTDVATALTTASEAKTEAESATELATDADTKADNAVTVATAAQTTATQADAKADANTTKITNIETELSGMITYVEL